MSKNEVKASKEVQDEAEPDSVFDFLYHDSRRIASFLSQFDANGLLTGITQGDSVAKGAKRSKKVSIGGDVPIMGGGSLEFEIGPGETGSQSLERAYDPFWSNARLFLDVLAERNLIQRDIPSARIGQFGLVSGSLIIADMKMLQSVWGLPGIQRVMAAAAQSDENAEQPTGNRQQRRSAPSPNTKPKVPDEIQMVMEILPHLPHSGHMHIVTDELAVWAAADEGSIVGSISDLVLKHGAKIAGQWNMLGIIDALPFEVNEMLSAWEMIQVGMTGENITKAALNLAPYIRQALGRPLMSYGMTPLLVFREVA